MHITVCLHQHFIHFICGGLFVCINDYLTDLMFICGGQYQHGHGLQTAEFNAPVLSAC